MTSPTAIPGQPPAPDAAPADGAEPGPLSLRRVLRTASAETWEVVAGEADRVGLVTVQYGPDAVEGVLCLPEGADADAVRGILAWVTDLLVLDTAAGPGGMIHWVATTGSVEDFWRRSPGRRPSGAQLDVAAAKARVEQVLASMFEKVEALPEDAYAVDMGSVRVFVGIRTVSDAVMVRVFSLTNVDVPVDGDLPRHLLALNFGIPLGRFSLDVANRTVWFDHMIGADELDDALARTLANVAATADKFDDEIKSRFGGRTFREEGSPVDAAHGQPGMAGGYL